jgi:uncharacterized membrane protein
MGGQGACLLSLEAQGNKLVTSDNSLLYDSARLFIGACLSFSIMFIHLALFCTILFFFQCRVKCLRM